MNEFEASDRELVEQDKTISQLRAENAQLKQLLAHAREQAIRECAELCVLLRTDIDSKKYVQELSDRCQCSVCCRTMKQAALECELRILDLLKIKP